MMALKNYFINNRYNIPFWFQDYGCIQNFRIYKKKKYQFIIVNVINLFLYEMCMLKCINNIYRYKTIII